jgi:hypothetical protein
MARRVLLGKAGSDQGFFVSKSGTDVVNSSGVLTSGENLLFDSRVGIGSLPLKFHGEGLLGVPPNVGNSSGQSIQIQQGFTSSTKATITHNLGYKPYCIVQWCFQSDLDSNGIATKMYPITHTNYQLDAEFSDYGQRVQEYSTEGVLGVWYEVTTTQLIIYNNMQGEYGYETLDGTVQYTQGTSGRSIAYAFLIFDVQGVDTI